MPFDPMKASGGAFDTPPAFSTTTLTWPAGVTERTTLPCTSLNQSVPSGRQSGPSVNLKPPATFSMTVPGATSASSDGSRRSIFPVPPGAIASRATRESPDEPCFSVTLHLVVQDDRIVPGGRHRRFHRRPYAPVSCRRDPFLPQLLAFELELESVIVRRRNASLDDRPAPEHLH